MKRLQDKSQDEWKSFRVKKETHIKLKRLSHFHRIKMSKILENFIEEEYEKNREAMRKAI